MQELLAPAGSFACAEAAFAHGADAAYAGIGSFNLRAHSPNFTVDEFSELVEFAEDRGKKVYCALNIMPNDQMLDSIENTLDQIAQYDDRRRPHAFIVSDPGVLSTVTRILPGIPIHLSTQNGCFNSASMKFWRKQGVSRVILPRELNLQQIRGLSSVGMGMDTEMVGMDGIAGTATGYGANPRVSPSSANKGITADSGVIETEIFIHGAMCVSISGRCLLGAYYNGRHPNLGDCPQPCRFRYRIVPNEQGVDFPHDGFDAEESGAGVYLLNSKDLCTIDIMPAIIASGAVSFKIEGRNKSAHYVASVVKVYRDAIDTCLADPKSYQVKEWWVKELDAIEHRPYTTGFYAGDPIKQELFSSKAQTGYRLVGTVKAVIDGCPVVDVKNSFSALGEMPESESSAESKNTANSGLFNVLPVRHGRIPFDFSFEGMRELDGGADGRPQGSPLQNAPIRARPNRLVILDGCSEALRVGDIIRMRVC